MVFGYENLIFDIWLWKYLCSTWCYFYHIFWHRILLLRILNYHFEQQWSLKCTVWFFMHYLFKKKIIFFMEKKLLLSVTLVSSLSFLLFSFSSFVSFLLFLPLHRLRMSSKQDFAPRSRRNGTSNSDWYQALRLFCKKICEKIYWAIIIHYFPILRPQKKPHWITGHFQYGIKTSFQILKKYAVLLKCKS